ncbi:MAG TPA: CocE/NonD family hydrolase [Acidimicrobiales bacterium]|nr:CocE/NonD family hydrolase [Acidimicrobiales bacterium]
MRPGRLALHLAVLLTATLLSPVVLPAAPVAAHGPCTASSETDYYPATSPWSDGTKVRIRMISPAGGASCPGKPTSGWPLVIYLHGNTVDRCSNMPVATRSTIATWGYVVLSFTARGGPGSNGISGSACDQATNAADALDDNGRDLWGPRDKKDVTELINWARDHYTTASCPTQCVDENKVAVTGFSYGGARTWAVGVPGPPGHPTHPGPNQEFDSRVKAIAPAAAWSMFDNLKRLSNDGATPTSTLRPRAGSGALLWWSNQGWFTHTDRPVVKHITALDRSSYRNLAVPPDAASFWDARMLVDDDPAVDQVHHITMPVFVMAGWLDDNGAIYNEQQIEAFNKLPASNADKYLYLGSCSHTSGGGGDPCLTTNRTRMADALHRFFDKYLKGATDPVGGPVFYTIPPKWVSLSDNPWVRDNWTESQTTAWPPPTGTTTETRYFRNNGTLTTTSESGTTCTPSTPGAKGTGCSTFNNNRTNPMYHDLCIGTGYAGHEVQSFDWAFTADKKVARLEADLHVSSDTPRLQVYVDLELVDSAGNFILRVWRSTAQVTPVKRDGTAGTVYRFKFVPGGSAWTVANGQKLRIKVASKNPKAFPGEPLPGTYTLRHNNTYQSAVTLTYVP